MAIMTNSKTENIDFVVKFNNSIQALTTLLGVTDVQVLAPGSALKVYKTSGTLQSEQVAKTEEITASNYGTEEDSTKVLTIKKYYKLTGIEDIAKYGPENAIIRTDDAMIRDIQTAVRGDIFTAIKTGTGTAKGTNFQTTLANAWGALNVAFESEQATPVYFANPLDVAEYLGDAPITMQTAFGLSYIANFFGLGTVVVDSKVEQGKIYATASENINVVTADLTSIAGEEGFYTDDSGMIGVKHNFADNRASESTLAVTGLVVFPSFLDRVIIGTITPNASGSKKVE